MGQTKKRGHGEGTVYARCINPKCKNATMEYQPGGRYRCPKCGGNKVRFMGQVFVTLPDGTRKRKTVYGETQKKVTDAMADLRSDDLRGETVDPGKETVGEYLERWLRDIAATRVRPTTFPGYQRYLRLHAIPQLGAIPLARLQPSHLQRLYAERLAAGKSATTIKQLHTILHSAFESAVKLGLMVRNPTDAVDRPKTTRYQPTVLNPDAVPEFVAALEGDLYGDLYYLAITAGCRRSELLGLRWSDVDLHQGTISIQQGAHALAKQGIVYSDPKSSRSRRLIKLPKEAIRRLKAVEHAQKIYRAKNAPVYEDHDLVFCARGGSPLNPSQVSHHFKLLREKYGLPHVRLHDLRHTHATMLLKAGVHPKIVSERLGHSTITLTMDTYSHVLPDMQDQVTAKLDTLMESPATVNGNRPKRGNR